jgi:hypothetical protein
MPFPHPSRSQPVQNCALWPNGVSRLLRRSHRAARGGHGEGNEVSVQSSRWEAAPWKGKGTREGPQAGTGVARNRNAQSQKNGSRHDASFRAAIQEALDDPRPPVPHAEVNAHFAKLRSDALSSQVNRYPLHNQEVNVIGVGRDPDCRLHS